MAKTLALHPRTPGTTRDARAVRRTGKVPGILYGRGNEPLPFAVDVPALRETLSGDGGRHAVFELTIDGRKGSIHAVLKDFQLDPVRDRLLHVDLLEISMTEPIVAMVVVRLEGESPGVRDGGVLDQSAHEVEVEALPAALPAELVVDVSGLEVGSTIKAGDIAMPTGVTLVTDPEAGIASITQATTMEQIEAEQAAEAGIDETAGEAEGETGEGDAEPDAT